MGHSGAIAASRRIGVSSTPISVSFDASSDSFIACGLSTTLTKYFDSSGIIGNGTILYNDASLTTVYTGAAKFYHRIGVGTVGYISSLTGEISNFTFCV